MHDVFCKLSLEFGCMRCLDFFSCHVRSCCIEALVYFNIEVPFYRFISHWLTRDYHLMNFTLTCDELELVYLYTSFARDCIVFEYYISWNILHASLWTHFNILFISSWVILCLWMCYYEIKEFKHYKEFGN